MTASEESESKGDDASATPPSAPPPHVVQQEVSEGTGDLQSYIGARLRQEFDAVASQPVPDRFLQLMRELDRA